MWSRISAVVWCSAKASSGRRWTSRRRSTISSKTASPGAVPNRLAHRQRPRRSRAMWVTWISSVPA